MTDAFIINPKASLNDLGEAITDRVTQARAVCMFAIGSDLNSTGNFIQNTFWTVESLLKDVERLNAEIDRRAVKNPDHTEASQ